MAVAWMHCDITAERSVAQKTWVFAPRFRVLSLYEYRDHAREVIPLATATRTQPRASQMSAPPDAPIAATDGELLMRFVRQRDQAAFAEIVQRHGGLVWMISRQIL